MSNPVSGKGLFLDERGDRPEFQLKFLNDLRESLADRLPEDFGAPLDERVK